MESLPEFDKEAQDTETEKQPDEDIEIYGLDLHSVDAV